ncbi:CHAT domain-containing protein [Pyxidicoccus xibeiensis]|uniref:CHAT domain-containing protein n=1 Tax=Pyxidicoccus xibeiensis TaxID=2906759 RepID=UPI0020A82A0A|nr:CHAT domain-containing protein [Pyxidicoccus xibeiensis]MCP3138995.1 CHAT domain-containing protein [Pyxidicoccus xibeiensis]
MTELLQLRMLARRHMEGADERAPAPVPAPRAPIPLFRRRTLVQAVAGLAAAVLVVVAVPRMMSSEPQHDVWLAKRPQRLLEARVAYPGADDHRPQASRMMGNDDGAPEALPHKAMSWLEEQEDVPGIVAAYLVRDDPGLADQALLELDKLERTPERENDRAVAMLLKGRPDEALRLVDGVLRGHPRHPQALWNRALALRELGLPLVAASAFKEVADLHEPGWSDEAKLKADELRSTTFERHKKWKTAYEAGKALREAPPTILPRSFSQFSMARLYLYDAVRSAPNRERVLALLPLAQDLDARAGGDVLEKYVRHVSNANFSRRGPLALGYAAFAKERPSRAEQERQLAVLLSSGENDIFLGVLQRSGITRLNLKLYEARAASTGDLWFKLLAAQERAKLEFTEGNWKQATRTLQAALGHCPASGFEYRCLSLELDLISIHIQHIKVDDALSHVTSALKIARENNEWWLEQELLWNRARISRVVNDSHLTRAYLGEYLERGRGDPTAELRAHQILASMAFQELRVDEARREIDAALATGQPLLFAGAMDLAEISRLKRAPDDEAHLLRALESARSELSEGKRVLATHVRGRFYIEQDAERGRALLWKAIEEAEAEGLKDDSHAKRARTYSYTSLLHDAGRRGAYREALELFERERGVGLPAQCLLAVTADSERTLLVARGTAGELVGYFDESRRQPLEIRLGGVVPEMLLTVLRACSRVEVLARPPLHGRAGLLPPELAWSYLTRTAPTPTQRTGSAVHLVVSDVEPPPGSSLKRLNAWTPGFGPDEQRVTLVGAEATPPRVLAAMKDATEVDLVAHGVVDGHADTSYLLLAPGPDGYELTVPQVRASSLRGAPFVVLAACRAAHTAYVLDAPFSLPASFIEAGARGVLAATVEIPDLEAGTFFNAVRERIRRGEVPAIALRDERMKWLGENRGVAWLPSVLLFE